MGERVQTEKQAPQENAPTNNAKPAADLKPKADEIKSKADEIADMIDDVLEKNAEAFVQAYVQRGGE